MVCDLKSQPAYRRTHIPRFFFIMRNEQNRFPAALLFYIIDCLLLQLFIKPLKRFIQKKNIIFRKQCPKKRCSSSHTA